MSCMQITACGPFVNSKDITSLRCLSFSQSCVSPNYALRLPKASLRLASITSRYQACTPVCVFGGKGKAENDNEASPWKSLENAMGGLRKEKSVQDILREQMQKQEFDDSGGGIGSPPSSGGGDGSGGSEDEGFSGILDEFLQVILATIGIILMYLYIIDGEDITKLTRDYIKYFFTKKKSVRVTRSMEKWRSFYNKMIKKKKPQRRDWLERAILNTPTWGYSPREFKRLLRNHLPSPSYRRRRR